MPNRILREGILTSTRVNALSLEAELFFRRLMSVVDDHGRFHAHPALLRAAMFPLRLNQVQEADIARLMREVERQGLVRVYEVAGKLFLELLEFRQQIRNRVSKYPDPEGDDSTALAMHLHSTCVADGAQTLGNCIASAHLDGGEGGDVVEDEGGDATGAGREKGEGIAPAALKCESQTATAPRCAAPPALHTLPTPGTPAPPASASPAMQGNASPAVEMAILLRQLGVNITSMHPALSDWVTRGLTLDKAREAVELARQRKPRGTIAANYLGAIINDILEPPQRSAATNNGSNAGKAATPSAWWASESATLAHGNALGIQPRPGESMAEYRSRLGNARTAHTPSRAQAAAP